MSSQEYIEGRNPIIEALKADRNIKKILIADRTRNKSINKIIKLAKKMNIQIEYLHRSKLDSISQTQSHQGVIALAEAYKYKTLDYIFNYAKKKNENPFIIILDEIKDPHNLGSIMRTAECAGAHGIIIPKRRAAGVTPVVLKTSAGAIEYLPVVQVSNIANTIDILKEKGLWIYGADMQGEKYYYEQSLKGAIGLVIGSEGKGMRRLVKEKCDFLIKIPMKGRVSSLNASVAASILMYEILKQRSIEYEK